MTVEFLSYYLTNRSVFLVKLSRSPSGLEHMYGNTQPDLFTIHTHSHTHTQTLCL